MYPLLLLLVLSTASSTQANTTALHSTTMDSATASTSGVTPPPLLAPVHSMITPTDTSGPGEAVGTDDARLLWMPWSRWSCNCPAGAMSRVREAYHMSDIGLSTEDFNRKRFQRVVCDYQECLCDRALGQCNHERADCPHGEDYQCALRDLSYAERHTSVPGQRGGASNDHIFWEHISLEVNGIWDKLKKAFRAGKRQAAAKGKAKTRRKVTKKNKKSTGRR